MASIAAPDVNVARLLDDGAWSGLQKAVLLLASLAFAVDGFANQVLGLAIPSLIRDWHVGRDVFAPVIALGLAGLAVGTIAGGMLGDRYGRRATLIGAVVLFGAATALIAFVDGIGGLTVQRMIAGLGLGAAIPNATSLIAEYTPARRRSLAIAVGMVFIPLGGILSGGAAAALSETGNWRNLFLAAGVCSLVVAVVLWFGLPESPRYLLGRPARHAELRTLMGRFGHRIDPQAALIDDDSGRRLSVPIKRLFEPGIRRDTLALWAAFFACLLATYSIQSWAPTVFDAMHVPKPLIGALLATFGAGGIVGSLAAGAAIERAGSRTTIAVAALATVALAVALAFVAGAGGITTLLVLLGLLGAAVSAVQSPLYALAAYVYPPACRASGVGMGSAMGRMGALASSFTGVLTLDAGGPRGFFLFIGLAILCCLGATSLIRRHIAAS